VSTHRAHHTLLVAVFAMVAVVAAGLAACGGSTPPPSPTVTVTASSTSSPSAIASTTAGPTPAATTVAIAAAVGLKTDTLALLDASGGQTVLVPGDGHILTDVQISPGGRYIAYTKVSAHDLYSLKPRTLMVYDIVAGRSKPVSFGAIAPATVGGHAWVSPTELVVVAYNSMPKNATTNGTLARCDLTTWTATALTDASGATLKGDAPSATADGASLASITYSNYKPPVVDSSGVWTYGGSVTETLRLFHVSGGSVTNVARAKRMLDVEGSPFGRATISPDGSKIFTQQTGSDVGFGATIYNTDGSKPKRFGPFVFPGGATWDPSGSGELVFAGSMDTSAVGSGLLLYGQGVTQIFKTKKYPPSDVAWSPDGTSLAFTAFSRTVETPKAPDLWVIGVDGTGLHLRAKHASSPSWGAVVAP
jgi:dipeptidyl aminopeptidase/acylaminoacyl peptidase